MIEAAVDSHTGGVGFADDWDWEGMWVGAAARSTRSGSTSTDVDRHNITREELLDRIFDDAISAYEAREQEWAGDGAARATSSAGSCCR